MGKFVVRFGTYQGRSNIVMVTGQRLFGFNLPPRLAAWLNQPSAMNAFVGVDLDPDGHYVLTYRRKDGSLSQLRSPGLEDWLGIPRLPLTTTIAFAFGYPSGLIATYDDPRTGLLCWSTRDIPAGLSKWMAKHGIQWNANIHEFDLGFEGSWVMITGTVSGYHVGDVVKGLIRGGGNGCALSKMAADQCYLELPLPYLRVSTTWITTLSGALNDAPTSSLVSTYYDEHKHVVVLPGEVVLPGGVLAAKPSRGAFLTGDNFPTGLNIINSTMVVVVNVTGGAVTASTMCWSIM